MERFLKFEIGYQVIITIEGVMNDEHGFDHWKTLRCLIRRRASWPTFYPAQMVKEVNVPDLVDHGTDGARVIHSGLQELRDAGHVIYSPTLNEKQQIAKWATEVHERPIKISQNNP